MAENGAKAQQVAKAEEAASRDPFLLVLIILLVVTL